MHRTAKLIRKERGFSLMAVARLTTISPSHLWLFENGQAGLSIAKLQELATLYSVSVDELIREAS